MNEKRSVRTLTSEEIQQALEKLSEEAQYRPSFGRLVLSTVIGMLPFVVLCLFLLALAYRRINTTMSYWLAGTGGVLWIAYSFGKRRVPEAGFDYKSTLVEQLSSLGLSKEKLEELWSARARNACLLNMVFVLSFFACLLGWIGLAGVAWISRDFPPWLMWVAFISLVLFSISWMMTELRQISYYQNLSNLERSFRLARSANANPNDPVEVGEDLLNYLEKVELTQALRKAVKASRTDEWVPMKEIDFSAFEQEEPSSEESNDQEARDA